ncbi:MAG: hypothetical protein ICV60_05715 [Pyrinomonadaceae bacterium]|nr:hypothetical protein [Pyrinomonadaceae bacterium]
MKINWKWLTLIIVLDAMLAMLVACAPAKAIYGASVGIGEAIDVKRDLAQAGELRPDDERRITQALLDSNRALLQVTDTADCFTQFTSDVKENVLRAADNTITSLDNLQKQGALRIKSEKAKKRFDEKILYAKLGVRSFRTALALMPATKPSPSGASALTEKQQRQLDELRDLCRKASAQLRLNDSRLVDDLARLNGTNPER